MSNEDANNYDKLEKALLTRYSFTENGYRQRLRDVKADTDETSDQFVVHLKNYLAKWLELSESSPMLWWISWSKKSLSTSVLTSLLYTCLKEDQRTW